MSGQRSKRATVYFESGIYNAICLKAAQTQQSVSDIVNNAVSLVVCEDQDDLAAFDKCL